MARIWLIPSTVCFLISFAYTVHALRAGTYQASRRNYLLVVAGWVFQTIFLQVRGQAIGHCPLTNLFEIMVFLCWAMALIYLIIGTAYRISLLGAFTSPVVCVLQTLALVLPLDQSAPSPPRESIPLLELHAAVSVMAYGAFALAGVAGAMYLLQERQLKRRQLKSLFHHLPPIRELGVVNTRLMLLGFGMLTAGLAAGFALGTSVGGMKLWAGVAVWVLYGVILQLRWVKTLTPGRAALLSIWAFTFSLMALWGFELAGGGGA